MAFCRLSVVWRVMLICIASLGLARVARAGEDPPSEAIQRSAESVFAIGSPIGDIEYRSARGLRIGDTGLNIGGFSTVEIDREEGEPLTVALDSLNFLILFEPIDAFRVFAELEVGDLFSYESKGPTDSDPRLDVERLYGELSLSDPINLLFGKFQTPVGRWNLVPAEPFVWTATEPVVLDTAIDEHQTGVALSGSFFPSKGTIEYWLYGQVVDPLDPSDSPKPTDRSVGARLAYTHALKGWSLGSSFLASELGGDWSFLGGLDGEARFGRLELLSELTYQNGDIEDRDILDVWLQGRYEILRGFSLVARYEYFDRIGSKRDDVHLGDVGIAWQPFPWVIVKGTYRFSDQETDDVQRGVASSISVVF